MRKWLFCRLPIFSTLVSPVHNGEKHFYEVLFELHFICKGVSYLKACLDFCEDASISYEYLNYCLLLTEKPVMLIA